MICAIAAGECCDRGPTTVLRPALNDKATDGRHAGSRDYARDIMLEHRGTGND